jgi:hypothetical protein
MEKILSPFFEDICWIEPPVTLDGGDVYEAGITFSWHLGTHK